MTGFTLPSWRTVKLLVGAAVLAFLGFQLFLAKADARHWKKQAEQTQGLRETDQKTWKDAAVKATYDAVFNVYRTEAARAKINERATDALAHDRDRAVTAYERLQRQADTYLRSPGSPDLSAEREATCRAVAGTGCEGIPPLLKAAQDNTDQLRRLIAAVREHEAVPTVPSSTEPAEAAPN